MRGNKIDAVSWSPTSHRPVRAAPPRPAVRGARRPVLICRMTITLVRSSHIGSSVCVPDARRHETCCINVPVVPSLHYRTIAKSGSWVDLIHRTQSYLPERAAREHPGCRTIYHAHPECATSRKRHTVPGRSSRNDESRDQPSRNTVLIQIQSADLQSQRLAASGAERRSPGRSPMCPYLQVPAWHHLRIQHSRDSSCHLFGSALKPIT
jgi:hypothetical protein